MRRTPRGMRELISRITVSASGRLTEPLKCTLLGGMAGCLPRSADAGQQGLERVIDLERPKTPASSRPPRAGPAGARAASGGFSPEERPAIRVPPKAASQAQDLQVGPDGARGRVTAEPVEGLGGEC
jgi:hypothetical protein